MKIVSLVPSQTELLFDLGLRDEVVGITKFCVYPDEWFRTKTRIGGTKNISIEKIKQLSPDLILANKEENVKEQVEELATYFNVHTTDIKTLNDAIEMIVDVGELVSKKQEARLIAKKIEVNFRALATPLNITQNLKPRTKNPTLLYLIWNNPFMSVGNDTFIHNMLTLCSYENVCRNLQRYPEISSEKIAHLKPDIIFLSSEPFPFKQKHINELKAISPASKIMLVNGAFFSWYGSRLVNAPVYFEQLQKQLQSA